MTFLFTKKKKNELQTQMAASSSPRTATVYLSYGGEDTRSGFTTSLHNRLRAKAVQTFMEYDGRSGTQMSPLISRAIEGSKIAVVVFSKDYAASRSCLDELVKIFECRDRHGLTVLPVFYKVDPSDVERQAGVVGDALARILQKATMEESTRWTVALRLLALTPSTFTRREEDRRSEEKVMNEIVEKILKLLSGTAENVVQRGEAALDGFSSSLKESLPSTTNSDGVAELNFSRTNIQHLELGDKTFFNLKKIILKDCKQLVQVPDLSKAPNLEDLDVSGCTSLREVSSSIQHLNKLILLNFGGCKELATLPSSIDSPALEFLYLHGCTKIKRVPVIASKTIRALQVTGLPIREPSSGFNLDRILGCSSLLILSLQDCNLEEVPDSLGNLSSLIYLDLTRNRFKRLPTSIRNLSLLKMLKLSNCENLESIPELPANIEQVETHNCTALGTITLIPAARLGQQPQTNTRDAVTVTTTNKRVFLYSNCFKLVTNFGSDLLADATQKLQRMASLEPADTLVSAGYAGESKLSICFPGCEVPNWFDYRQTGRTMDVYLPQGWCNRRFIGFAFCAVVGPKPAVDMRAETEEAEANDFVSIECRLQNCYGAWYKSMLALREGGIVPISTGREVFKSKHVLLAYDTSLNGKAVEEGKVPRVWAESNQNIALFDFLVVRSERPMINYEVQKCGVRLLYSDDPISAVSATPLPF